MAEDKQLRNGFSQWAPTSLYLSKFMWTVLCTTLIGVRTLQLGCIFSLLSCLFFWVSLCIEKGSAQRGENYLVVEKKTYPDFSRQKKSSRYQYLKFHIIVQKDVQQPACDSTVVSDRRTCSTQHIRATKGLKGQAVVKLSSQLLPSPDS